MRLSAAFLSLFSLCCASVPPSGIHVRDNQIFNGSKPLTPRFLAIDSFAVSPVREEVVFSARRADNFDVGLVATEGSEIKWVPEDPADETSVQWATRSNMISYILHLNSGDIVRSVHVPTGVQLSTDFPHARVKSVTWDPSGERYSVTFSSADASERTESMKFNGEERRVITPPARQLDVQLEPLAGGLVMRPSALKYNEKLPLVVWTTRDPNSWNDSLGELMKSARVAALLVPQPPSESAKAAIAAVPWIDAAHSWVVGESPVVQSKAAREIAGALTNGRR